jgi:hypothetical protein
MTDQEAIEFYLSKVSLKIWQRLLFFAMLFAVGCWLMSSLLWAVSESFYKGVMVFVAVLFLISCIMWNAIALPKHMGAVFELRNRGYKKWRRFQWDFFIRCFFQVLQPTAMERTKHPWLLPITIMALTFPILGIVMFIVSFYL